MREGDTDLDTRGEARRASAAIEAFLSERGRPEPPDAGALLDLRLALAAVCGSDLVGGDPQAAGILREMVTAESMEALDADVVRLGRRVAELTGGRARSQGEARLGRPARRMLRL